MNNLKIYCITHKITPLIEQLGLIPFGVGIKEYPENYIKDNSGENIAYKNSFYSETTFHYWYWKNELNIKNNDWFGMCQYRKVFVKLKYRNEIGQQGFIDKKLTKSDLKEMLQLAPAPEWQDYDVVICDPWDVRVPKLSKLIKNGFRSILNEPSILINKKKHTIKLHFDMYHGYGNLDKAINTLPLHDQKDFRNYVNTRTELKGHCIFFSNKPLIVEKFYEELFDWLFKCEKIFGFDNLKGYGLQRMYSFLTERFMPYWFEKNARTISWPWIFHDLSKD